MKSKFSGSPSVIESSASNQLITNGINADKFDFYNTDDCYIRINKSSIIFLFAGQGFSCKKDTIFSFEVINDMAIVWNDSSLWDDTQSWNDILVLDTSGVVDAPDFNYCLKSI